MRKQTLLHYAILSPIRVILCPASIMRDIDAFYAYNASIVIRWCNNFPRVNSA